MFRTFNPPAVIDNIPQLAEDCHHLHEDTMNCNVIVNSSLTLQILCAIILGCFCSIVLSNTAMTNTTMMMRNSVKSNEKDRYHGSTSGCGVNVEGVPSWARRSNLPFLRNQQNFNIRAINVLTWQLSVVVVLSWQSSTMNNLHSCGTQEQTDPEQVVRPFLRTLFHVSQSQFREPLDLLSFHP